LKGESYGHGRENDRGRSFYCGTEKRMMSIENGNDCPDFETKTISSQLTFDILESCLSVRQADDWRTKTEGMRLG
jgi:hypothetical protein